MTYVYKSMAEARTRCAELGITPARSLAETSARIASAEARMPRTPEEVEDKASVVAATEAETIKAPVKCDCDPASAANEHWHGTGAPDCECRGELCQDEGCPHHGTDRVCISSADYLDIEARAFAHMVEASEANKTEAHRAVAMSELLAAPYGTRMVSSVTAAAATIRDAAGALVKGFFGETIKGDVPGMGDAIRWKRSRPRQDVGTVAAFMVPVNGDMPHRKSGTPRPAASYRAARRAMAKQMRHSARHASGHLVPA
jgi:hypothetical protein